MLSRILKTSLRNLRSKKGFAFLNIGGLVLGLSCFMLIGLYVQNELSYDRHHERVDEIHRLGLHIFLDGTESNFATVAAPVAQGLVDTYPEVTAATRLNQGGFPVLRYEDKAFSEERFFWADSTVFDVFTMPFLAGVPKTALVAPYSIVFTESMAIKYFGDVNPVGKTVNMDNNQDYTVTGVIEDIPEASHFHPDFLASMSSRQANLRASWATNNNFATYFLLDPSMPAPEFQEKLKALVVQRVYPEISQLFNTSVENVLASGAEFEYLVHPITDLHLRSNLRAQFEPSGNILYVYLFSGIAFAILLIACINYVNLSTAVSAQKAKEVGIRKAVGSSRRHLVAQFLSDSTVLSLISMGIALLVVKLAVSPFSTFTGKELELPILGNPFVIPGAIALALMIGLIAGSYPAFVLSSFNPATVLKGSVKGNSKSALRNGLIVFQYSVSAVLVLAALVVYGQLEYIQNTNLGFSGDQVVVVEKTDDIADQLQAFKRSVLSKSSVVAVGNSSGLFGEISNDNLFRAADQPESENKLIFLNRTDEGYAETYQLEMVAGRYFSADYPGEANSIVLNETAVSLLGLGDDPVGRELIGLQQDHNLTVVGVVKDFHAESLQNEIKPFGFRYFGENRENGIGRNLSVRVASTDLATVLGEIEEEWYAISNGQAFEYEFFDSVFEERYLAEKSVGQVLLIFAGIAILIACLGLFGLAAFVTLQRTKEIGIRKSLGASASGIVVMLFRDFGKWIVLANVIAWPIAYYVMNDWLQNFVFRTNINLVDFPLALVAGLVVAFLTISYTTIRAAQSNPVKSLRYE